MKPGAAPLNPITDTHLSFAVEASAGAGKTYTLIERIKSLVFAADPKKRVRMKHIAAITFTEKAAGEMRTRLRQVFENSTHRELAAEALRDLDGAAVDTLHGFALSILREHPIEAAVDPKFTLLDEFRSRELFNEVWEEYFRTELDRREAAVLEIMRAGARPHQLQELVQKFNQNRAFLKRCRLQAPRTDAQFIAEAEALARNIRAHLQRCNDSEDKRAAITLACRKWLEDVAENIGTNAPVSLLKVNKGGGRPGAWSGGDDDKKQAGALCDAAMELSKQICRREGERALFGFCQWAIERFLPHFSAVRRERGLLDFDDLIELAAKCVASAPVQREIAQRYKALLIDEFQDTNPEQMEMVLAICGAALGEGGRPHGTIDPGRLFLVGDPKQSIYRFRCADVETYLNIAGPLGSASLGLERHRLEKNYRSLAAVVGFANHVFPQLLEAGIEEGIQAAYEPVSPVRQTPASAVQAKSSAHAKHVSLVRDSFDRQDRGKYPKNYNAELEARRIASLIRRMYRNDAWPVADSAVPGGTRPAEYRDIAVLMPKLSNVEALEDALRDAGVPYAISGGKMYFVRPELSTAITGLRAIADPRDGVAVYGILRSVYFGLSDEDLLAAHLADISLDYRRELPASAAAARLRRPFAILKELHAHRDRREPAQTLALFLSATGVRSVLAATGGGRQALANLEKLASRLRELSGTRSYAEVVDQLSRQDDAEIDERESRIVEDREDAVRILTVHKAKGLEFPITILAGFGGEPNKSGESIVLAPGMNAMAVHLGDDDGGFYAGDWRAVKDAHRQREKAESMRLLYVAATRARDYLVVSCHYGWNNSKDKTPAPKQGSYFGRLANICESMMDQPPAGLDFGVIEGDELSNYGDVIASTGAHAETLSSALHQIEHDCKALALITALPAGRELKTPSELKISDAGVNRNEISEAAHTAAASERGRRIGSAVHTAMQEVNWPELNTSAAIVAGEQFLRRRLREQTERESAGVLLRNLIESATLDRARRAHACGRRVLRELPFIRPEGSCLIEGTVDLAFEEEDGWVIVDYKTDRIASPATVGDELRVRYQAQLKEYGRSLAAVGLKVKALLLLSAQTAEAAAVEMPSRAVALLGAC